MRVSRGWRAVRAKATGRNIIANGRVPPDEWRGVHWRTARVVQADEGVVVSIQQRSGELWEQLRLRFPPSGELPQPTAKRWICIQ